MEFLVKKKKEKNTGHNRESDLTMGLMEDSVLVEEGTPHLKSFANIIKMFYFCT